jgi:hypothetical protein
MSNVITLPTAFVAGKAAVEDYRRRLAESARDDRALRAHFNRRTSVVKLLVPLTISGIPRPVGYMVDILTADAIRLIEQGKVECFDL